MTELFLARQSESWQQVFFESTSGFKLTRENPYFTQADSYTLDVTIPMDILENRRFFKNLQRMDASKRPPVMQCRLLVENRPLIQGSARVTQVTELAVKVQLIGGNSEINFLSDDNNDYIDELPLGTVTVDNTQTGVAKYVTTNGIRLALSPTNDETNGGWTNHFHFSLVDIMEKMLEHYGYTVTSDSVNIEPWNKVFVASALQTTDIAHTLPHWKPRTFIEEFSKFFNVTFSFNQIGKTVAIVGTPDFFTNAERISVEPADEYTSELTGGDDAHALAADRLVYDMSSSTHHDYDVIPDNVRNDAPSEDYGSKSEALTAYNGMSATERLRKIFRCPVGRYTGWQHDYSDVGDEQPRTLFTQIDVFGPLEREGGSDSQLKICPVAIGTEEYVSTFGNGGSFGGGATSGNEHVRKITMTLPSLENPTGNDTGVKIGADGAWGRGRRGSGSESESEDLPTIQECVEGDADIEKAEKEDRLQVMFVDDVKQTHYVDDNGTKSEVRDFTFGFTDWLYKPSHKNGETHNHWSLSLNPTDADAYLGQLHQNGFTFNMKAKHKFRFISDSIPSATAVYIIRGKLYGCEKLEISLMEEGFNKLITGYFYEML